MDSGRKRYWCAFSDSFLLVGGIKFDGFNNIMSNIYLYNPDGDSWTLQDARLREPKIRPIAMMVDREIFEC
jgi:hypothetical protein